MDSSTNIPIEIVYALPKQQTFLTLSVAIGSTIQDAIQASDILQSHPDINLENNLVGIFGKVMPLTHHLRAKDRIEIYRPLIADPKEVRKQRATAGKKMKKGTRNDTSL